jgi:SNF2 family DNA or RNA helicase
LRLAERHDVVPYVADDTVSVARVKDKSLRVQFTTARDWLGVEGGVEIDDGDRVALRALIDALRSGLRYVQLDGGRLLVLEDALRERLGPLAALAQNEKNGGLRVGRVAALAVVAGLGNVDDDGAVGHVDASALGDTIDAVRAVDDVPADGISATLRPYQREGLRFLRRLTAMGTGGVLADDMGLGKTLTSICLLHDRGGTGPQIVVAPTSLSHHWAREISRFSNALRPIVLAEQKSPAERQAAMRGAGKNDVVIASYGALVKDVDKVAGDVSFATFATMLVDEAQAVKNAATARAKALRAIPAEVRIALSGTPLENHTFELWAIMDLVAPGLFGTATQFKARFADPIEKEDDRARRTLLARALGPFVLRRTKLAVAPDLPPKLERTLVLTPSPEESHAYERLRKALIIDLEDRGVLETKERKRRDAPKVDPGQGRVQILSALTKLRLAACHHVLVDEVGDLAGAVAGTKHTALVSTLAELREQGHAALVFSQFVRHLDLAERFAQELGLRTLRLTGKTPGVDRQKIVDAFQAGEADAFFISLKAGGFGLNLTRASYVLHLDPWWNPATETQASDRAHRIGQTLPVTVTRLVMDHTIEREILSLHEHKRALADAVLDGSDVAGRLDADELMALLRHTRRAPDDGLQQVDTFISTRG